MPRELTLGRVRHPETFRPAGSGRELTLIEDPVADPINKGDRLLGWEGDDRLALYFDLRGRCYELWRLEHDGQYRSVMRFDADAFRGPELVANIVTRLVATDSRRGYNVKAAVDSLNEAVEREKRRQRDEFHTEAAERLRFGLIKDGV
jgi:hypothetical protein